MALVTEYRDVSWLLISQVGIRTVMGLQLLLPIAHLTPPTGPFLRFLCLLPPLWGTDIGVVVNGEHGRSCCFRPPAVVATQQGLKMLRQPGKHGRFLAVPGRYGLLARPADYAEGDWPDY